MKTLIHKKWFRRMCQILLAMVSLLVLSYATINWWGARSKRDVVAKMRAEGRPTSIAEMLKPLPRDEDNFAMIPILARARDEWWSDKSNGRNLLTNQARTKLREMALKEGNKNFFREGIPDLTVWKQGLKLSGNDAECLDAYDQKFGGILAELRAGMKRPETASPFFHGLAATSDPDWLGMTSGYIIGLAEVAESLGFRAELALAAGRSDVARESLSMAIRLSGLIGSEGSLVGILLQGRVIRYLQPTLARALQTAEWDIARVSSIKIELAALDTLNGFRRALDVENFATFAMFEEMSRHPEFIAWEDFSNVRHWRGDLLILASKRLPMGWYQENAAHCARLGLLFRGELGDGGDLRAWFHACERAEKLGQLSSNLEYWLYPLKHSFGAPFKNACRNQTLIQQALLACDLETYRLDHGRYPENLEETGSPAIIDTMTGEPFRYRISDTSYLLYSIGSDGKDNGGNQSKLDAYHKRDWVW